MAKVYNSPQEWIKEQYEVREDPKVFRTLEDYPKRYKRPMIRAHFNRWGQFRGYSSNVDVGIILLLPFAIILLPLVLWLGTWAMWICKMKFPGLWVYKILSFPSMIVSVYYVSAIVDAFFGTNWYNSLPNIF